jgi:DNA-binding response OmpR family regulator
VRILIADRTEDGCAGLIRLLTDAGHNIELVRALGPGDLHGRYELLILTRSFGADDVTRARAASPTLPVLALVEGDAEARALVIDAGADDAMSLPFAGGQMLARTSALGRRGALTPRAPEILEEGGCFIDLDRLRASRGSATIELAAREAKLIRFLHRHRGRGVTREEILEQVFEVSPEIESRSVDMAIAVLRRKLEQDPKTPRLITSVKGVGYAWGDLTRT